MSPFSQVLRCFSANHSDHQTNEYITTKNNVGNQRNNYEDFWEKIMVYKKKISPKDSVSFQSKDISIRGNIFVAFINLIKEIISLLSVWLIKRLSRFMKNIKDINCNP